MNIAQLPRIEGGDCPLCHVEGALRLVVHLRSTLLDADKDPDLPVPGGFTVAIDQVPTVYCPACRFEAQGFWSADGRRVTFRYVPQEEMSMR